MLFLRSRVSLCALALIMSLFAFTGSLSAACKTEACKHATAWKQGYTAIILQEDLTPSEYLGVLSAVQRHKGTVAIETERVLLGWVPTTSTGKIRSTPGIRAVFHAAVGQPEALVGRADGLGALRFYNQVLSGEYEDIIEAGLAETEPVNRCLRPARTGTSHAEVQSAGDSAGARFVDRRALIVDAQSRETAGGPASDPGRPPGSISPLWEGLLPLQNPDMRGRVTVQFFRLDSNGAVDPNTYTWTTEHLDYAFNQLMGAFTLWVNKASLRGVTLSFRIKVMDPMPRYLRRFIPTPTGYEPITRNSTDDYKWVNDALAPQGYGASPVTESGVFTRNEEFNTYWRNDPVYGPFNRSFSVYIVYNPVTLGAPRNFADGFRSYAMYDGPFTTILWNNGFRTESSLQLLINHETAHIFWACDEYDCFTCANCQVDKGPRNQSTAPWITNGNCDLGCGPLASCIMRSQLNSDVCNHTALQVGW